MLSRNALEHMLSRGGRARYGRRAPYGGRVTYSGRAFYSGRASYSGRAPYSARCARAQVEKMLISDWAQVLFQRGHQEGGRFR